MIVFEISIINKEHTGRYDISIFSSNNKKYVAINNLDEEQIIIEQDKLFDIIDKYFKENL